MNESAMSSRDELHCEMAAELLRGRGTLQFRALGSSMIPSLWPGDILKICPGQIADVNAGEIVLFSRESLLVAHRVVRNCGSALITRGDSLPFTDPPVGSELLGRVVGVIRDGREIQLQPGLSLPLRLLAWLVRHSGWCMRLCVRWKSWRRHLELAPSEKPEYPRQSPAMTLREIA